MKTLYNIHIHRMNGKIEEYEDVETYSFIQGAPFLYIKSSSVLTPKQTYESDIINVRTEDIEKIVTLEVIRFASDKERDRHMETVGE